MSPFDFLKYLIEEHPEILRDNPILIYLVSGSVILAMFVRSIAAVLIWRAKSKGKDKDDLDD